MRVSKFIPKGLTNGMSNNDKIRFYRVTYKKIVFDHYGWKCACCAETTPQFLTVDHVQNDGFKDKSGKKRICGYPMYMKIVNEGFGPRYQILCMNCNHGKNMNNGICPHNII
jgi:hypothetical protein